MNKIASNITNSLAFSQLTQTIYFLASKMQASSTQKTKDSAGKRLGIKVFGGAEVYPNDIIARQRGFKWKSGKDQTIHAKVEGIVHFRQSNQRKIKFYYIDVIPTQLPNRKYAVPRPYNYHPELFPDRAATNHPQIHLVDKYHTKIAQ